MLSCDKRLRENKSWKRCGTENWCRWVGCSRVVGHLKGERDTEIRSWVGTKTLIVNLN